MDDRNSEIKPHSSAQDGISYALVLEAAPSNLPPDQRLKMLLKLAWRGFKLRAVRCELVAQETEPGNQPVKERPRR